MRQIPNKDFNRDMDRYLTNRQARKSWGSNVFGLFNSNGSFAPKKKDDSDIPIERIEKMEEIKQKETEIKEIEGDIQELEEVEAEDEVKKEAVLSRMFSKLKNFFGPGKDDDFDDAQEEKAAEALPLDEEIKEVLKLTHKWITKLPPEELHAFRTSPDFEKYKTVLKKYGLIK